MADKKEYVEKETLINIMLNGLFPDKKIENPFDVLRAIKHAPTADVEKVKHARWIEESSLYVHCSNCRTREYPREHHFKSEICPECGAIMDGKPQEEGK